MCSLPWLQTVSETVAPPLNRPRWAGNTGRPAANRPAAARTQRAAAPHRNRRTSPPTTKVTHAAPLLLCTKHLSNNSERYGFTTVCVCVCVSCGQAILPSVHGAIRRWRRSLWWRPLSHPYRRHSRTSRGEEELLTPSCQTLLVLYAFGFQWVCENWFCETGKTAATMR